MNLPFCHAWANHPSALCALWYLPPNWKLRPRNCLRKWDGGRARDSCIGAGDDNSPVEKPLFLPRLNPIFRPKRVGGRHTRYLPNIAGAASTVASISYIKILLLLLVLPVILSCNTTKLVILSAQQVEQHYKNPNVLPYTLVLWPNCNHAVNQRLVSLVSRVWETKKNGEIGSITSHDVWCKRSSRGAYYWSHSFAKQHIDDRILHCLYIKKFKIAEPG